MVRKRSLWIQIAVWAGVYLFWVLLFRNKAFVLTRTMTVEFCYLLFIAANFYLNTWVLIPRLLYRKKYITYGFALLSGIVVAAFLRVPLALFLNEHYFLAGREQPGFISLFFNSLLNIFIWVICLIAGVLVMDKIRQRQYIDDLEQQKARNELDFLKAQFNPHFLFNSINSIYGHIDKNNATARSMLLTFSEMLRYQLYECNTEQIAIEKEVQYIRNYITLQQTRKEENLVILLDIGETVRGFSITPLLFTSFIENCFKHVSNFEIKENRIEISLQKTENSLLFKAFNTREDQAEEIAPKEGWEAGAKPDCSGKEIAGKNMENGIGIKNTLRRLELLCPGKYQLDMRNNPSGYEVILNLTLHAS
ncbi:sensor histidine kinase [Flavitalea flava]